MAGKLNMANDSISQERICELKRFIDENSFVEHGEGESGSSVPRTDLFLENRKNTLFSNAEKSTEITLGHENVREIVESGCRNLRDHDVIHIVVSGPDKMEASKSEICDPDKYLLIPQSHRQSLEVAFIGFGRNLSTENRDCSRKDQLIYCASRWDFRLHD